MFAPTRILYSATCQCSADASAWMPADPIALPASTTVFKVRFH